MPAFDTQVDHIDPHPFARRLKKALAKGRTTFTNLQSLCLRHHYLKTHGGWMIQSTSGARLEWISPTGHSYRRNAEWGPPPDFWRDHDRRVPVDQPLPRQSQSHQILQPARSELAGRQPLAINHQKMIKLDPGAESEHPDDVPFTGTGIYMIDFTIGPQHHATTLSGGSLQYHLRISS